MGELTVTMDGARYTLHLGMRQLGLLQDEFGEDLGPILKIGASGLPRFSALVRLIEVALTRHHPDAPKTLTDDLLAAHPGLFADLMAVTFPTPQGEADAQPGKTKAAR